MPIDVKKFLYDIRRDFVEAKLPPLKNEIEQLLHDES